MRIVGASLVNRFYVRDGWTRAAVAALLADGDINHVTPRYDREDGKGGPRDGAPLIYFAVYEKFPFLRSKIEEHEYEGYCDSEADFATKNKVVEDMDTSCCAY